MTASAGPAFSVIIPTLNEAESIDRLLQQLFALDELRDRLEVIVADDRSTDGTVERVRAWADTHPVRLVQRDGPPDLSASVVAGARAARGRWVAVMDADGSHPAATVVELFEILEQGRADIAVGSRHVGRGQIDDWPWYRRLISTAATMLAWPFTSVRDPMSGLFATQRELLASLPERPAGYKILLEVLVRNTPDAKVLEVPIRFTDRERGSSKMGLTTHWRFIQRLAALGGARVELGNASRFGLVGLVGLVVDLVFFNLLMALGITLAAAHMGSFVVATISNFTLNYRWSFAHGFAPDRSVAARYGRFLLVALLALALRGGVLAALIYGFGMSPAVAIIPAIVITAAINYLGSAFYVFPARDWQPPPIIRWRLAALAVIAYVFLLRLIYLGGIDLIPDEMYYWTWWNLHPDLSYLDHPPMVAWLIGLSSWLIGDHAWGVRLPTLILSPLMAWFVYLTGRDLIGRDAGLMAAMLTLILPAFFAGGFVMTPDAPLLAAWAGAVYFFQRALIQHDRRAFLGLGLVMGFGLLAKYSMVLLAPAALVFMLLDRRARAWFLRPEPYLAAVLAALIFSPVLIWNHLNDWASFQFQGGRRLGLDLEFSSHMVLVYLIIMLAPLAGWVALYVLGPVRRQLAPEPAARRFIMVMTLVPVLLFAVIGLFSRVKFHWTVPVWLPILPLIGATMLPGLSGARAGLRRIQRLWHPAIAFNLVLFGAFMHYIAIGLPGMEWREHGRHYMGWPEVTRAIDEISLELEAENGKRPLLVGMSKWAAAAAVSFYTENDNRDHITARNLVGMPGAQWEHWFDPLVIDPSRPVLLFALDAESLETVRIDQAIVNPGPLESRPILRRGQRVQTLYYRVGSGFKPDQVRHPGGINERHGNTKLVISDSPDR